MVHIEKQQLLIVHLTRDAILAEGEYQTEDKISRALLPRRLVFVLYGAERVNQVHCVLEYLVL